MEGMLFLRMYNLVTRITYVSDTMSGYSFCWFTKEKNDRQQSAEGTRPIRRTKRKREQRPGNSLSFFFKVGA